MRDAMAFGRQDEGDIMGVVFHADDYGITEQQARDILALSSACGGHGVLASVSIFANSPAFDAAAALAQPFVQAGKLKMALHVNLVEGRPCAPAVEVPLLVNQRGTFCNDFVGLLKLSKSSQRWEFRRQLQRECEAQIARYLEAFPQMKDVLRVDSHQHTHAVPAVFDALMAAARAQGCTLAHVRCPVEPLAPHRAAGSHMPPINLAKDALITWLWRSNRAKVPAGCESSLFCGVVLSGGMDAVTWPLVREFERMAADRAQNVEVLFHPVSVPVAECLDPHNTAFAEACASPARNREAECLRKLEDER